jgi:hypothetical protein
MREGCNWKFGLLLRVDKVTRRLSRDSVFYQCLSNFSVGIILQILLTHFLYFRTVKMQT